MQLVKFLDEARRQPRLGLVDGEVVRPLIGSGRITTVLHAENPSAEVNRRLGPRHEDRPLDALALLAPIDDQEVWGAGVTYERSKKARMDESEQGGDFYDLVYVADRPELFLKATPHRVAAPGRPIRARSDTSWCVPEPELALVLDDTMRMVGLTIGNDVSARDIEGVNPLYLPQAKVYDACCAVGPNVTLASALPSLNDLSIRLSIDREGQTIFEEKTSTSKIARSFDDLIGWLAKDNVFPNGVVLLTGTGIIPPDEFSLRNGDLVRIAIDGLGTLANPVVQDLGMAESG